jgi:hypothetical protein
MNNIYSDSNPFIVGRTGNTAGKQLGSLGLQLYMLKDENGIKFPQWLTGKTKPGEPLPIPGKTTEGNESTFGKGGEAAGAPGAETEPDLSAFDFSGATPEYTGPAVEAGDFATLVEPGAAEGLTASESAELSGLGASTAETGAGTAAGATAGTIFSTAAPYVAAAKVGMPIVGNLMEKWSPGEEGGGNIFQKGARITGENYYRPMEAVHAEIFGSEAPKWAQFAFNPAGYIFGKLF